MFDRHLDPIPQKPTTGLRYRIETLLVFLRVEHRESGLIRVRRASPASRCRNTDHRYSRASSTSSISCGGRSASFRCSMSCSRSALESVSTLPMRSLSLRLRRLDLVSRVSGVYFRCQDEQELTSSVRSQASWKLLEPNRGLYSGRGHWPIVSWNARSST
jgi:hypothetical protein